MLLLTYINWWFCFVFWIWCLKKIQNTLNLNAVHSHIDINWWWTKHINFNLWNFFLEWWYTCICRQVFCNSTPLLSLCRWNGSVLWGRIYFLITQVVFNTKTQCNKQIFLNLFSTWFFFLVRTFAIYVSQVINVFKDLTCEFQ